jgi:hypothetical protein
VAVSTEVTIIVLLCVCTEVPSYFQRTKVLSYESTKVLPYPYVYSIYALLLYFGNRYFRTKVRKYESTKVLSKVMYVRKYESTKVLSYFSPEVQYYVVLPEVRTEVESTKVLYTKVLSKVRK